MSSFQTDNSRINDRLDFDLPLLPVISKYLISAVLSSEYEPASINGEVISCLRGIFGVSAVFNALSKVCRH